MAAPSAQKIVSVTELLARARSLPPVPAPLAARLAAARLRKHYVPWRQIAALTDPSAFIIAAYRACLGREPHPAELPALTLAAPKTRADRLAYLDVLRRTPEAAALATFAPGLWLAARFAGLFAR